MKAHKCMTESRFCKCMFEGNVTRHSVCSAKWTAVEHKQGSIGQRTLAQFPFPSTSFLPGGVAGQLTTGHQPPPTDGEPPTNGMGRCA